MAVAGRYDALNTVLFATAGGSGALRQQLVDALDLQPGARVLEVGCGTGQVTQRLAAAGAAVVALDALPEMLAAARKRAPGATFLQGDVRNVELGGPYDAVVLSFVLHNLDGPDRRALLGRLAGALASGGRIGILEWALPSGGLRAAVWRRALDRVEPCPSVREVLAGAVSEDLARSGLRVTRQRPLAGGRVQLLVAVPAPPC